MELYLDKVRSRSGALYVYNNTLQVSRIMVETLNAI
jgi:hypothetical protein